MSRDDGKNDQSGNRKDGEAGARSDQERLREEQCCCSFFQRLASPYVFGVLGCFVSIIQVAAGTGTGGGVLSTIEKRFQLKTSELAPFLIVNDIMSVVMVLFVAYYGHTSHRPRIIGGGCMLIGVGLLLCTLPQFVYETPPQFSIEIGRNENGTGDNIYPVCQTGSTPAVCTEEEERNSGSLMWQVALIIVGQIFYGLGAAPILPLTITYMDDSLDRTSTSVYVACFFSGVALGPLLGFGVSSFSLSKHSDFYKGPVYATPDDPNWLGAWWLTYAIFGVLIMIIGLPIVFFPKKFHRRQEDVEEAEELQERVTEKVEETSEDSEVGGRNVGGLYRMQVNKTEEGLLTYVKGFLGAIRRLVTNLSFVAVVLGLCAKLAALSGTTTFMAKYLETQFSLSASTAPLLFGIMLAPGSLFGNMIGGILVKKLKLTTKGLARMVVIVLPFVFLLAPPFFLFGCDNRDIAGITSNYPNMTVTKLPNLQADCNAECACPADYTPICGSDGVTYATPCHAGCLATTPGRREVDGGNITIYTDCSCIGPNSPADPLGLSGDYDHVAIPGDCASDCSMLIPFIVSMMIGSSIATIVGNPGFMLQLRLVQDADRSVALGFTSMALRLLGFIPSPTIFGAVIDTACLFLQSSCGNTGNCLVYDLTHYRFAFHGLNLGFQVLSFIMMLVCYFSIRVPDGPTKDPKERNEINETYFNNSFDGTHDADGDTDQTMGALEDTGM